MRRVVIWDFLGRDGPCGCAFYGGVGALEVGERFREGGDVLQRSASDFRYMTVYAVRQRREERRNW